MPLHGGAKTGRYNFGFFYAKESIIMKRIYAILLTLAILTIASQTAIALPEGAIARLGKGQISGEDRSVQFSPDGKLLAVSTVIGIYLYDSQTLDEIALFETGAPMYSVAFNPDGTLLASGSQDGTVLLWYGRSIASIAIEPSTATLTAGQTQQFDVSALDADGLTVKISNVVVTWAVDGNIGSVDENGLFTAKVVGNGKLKAILKSDSSITGMTQEFTVQPGDAETVEVKPAAGWLKNELGSTFYLLANGSSQGTIQATVIDLFDNLVPTETVSMVIEKGGGSLGKVKNNGDGTHTATYTAGTKAGELEIKATTSNGKSGSVKLTLTERPALICAPISGTVGDAVKVTGSHFDANEKAGKLLMGSESVKIYAVGDTIVSGDEIYADETGGFVVSFAIPNRPGGSVKVMVGDAETTLDIKAQIIVSPESGRAGASVSLAGDGFGNSEKLKIDFGKTKNIKEVNSTIDGSFEASFQVDVQEPGEKQIVATGASSNISATKSFTLEPSVPDLVEVSASETTLVADDTQKTTVIISVKDAGGRAVIGADVTLKTELGSVSETAIDNKDGTYSTTYTAANSVGIATVTATAGDKSGSVEITLIPGPASTVEVVAEPDELYADGISQSTITITVKDKNGNPIENALVEMQASEGSITSPPNNGSSNYTATYTAGVIEGKATITATASGQGYSVNGKTEITLIPPPDKILTLNPPTGSVKTVVEITGEGFEPDTDVGKLTIGGVEIPVYPVGETVVEDKLIRANEDGTFVVRFEIPKRPGGGVIVAVGEGRAKFVITSRLSVNPEFGPTGTTINVEGDGFGGDEPVNVDFGDTKKILTEKTNPDGSLELTFNADTQEPGTKNILATGTLSGRNAEATFELISSEPATISIEANPKEIDANGVSTVKLTIRVEDADGYGVAGQKVNVEPERGKVSSVTEQGGGDYLATYTSDTKSGIVKIAASLIGEEIIDETKITLKPCQPETVTVEANPSVLSGDGKSESMITVTLKDAHGNLVFNEKVTMTVGGVGGTLKNDAGETGTTVIASNAGDGAYIATYISAQIAVEQATATVGVTTQNGVEGKAEINLNSTPDFLLNAEETTKKAQPGEPLIYFIEVTGQNGFNFPVELETRVLPKDVDATFSPSYLVEAMKRQIRIG